ncbi:MAG: membrane protein [Saprospiraceae bacterium]|nr:MAG: membrane protein [Saprospiraceae bacterium]
MEKSLQNHIKTVPNHILPFIIISQFAGTSLWFAGNAIMADLQQAFDLPAGSLGNITSAVQLGFIGGTLTFAFLVIADRFSPSKVFFVSATLGALANLSIYLFADGYWGILIFRWLTGFFLAGVYPIGMKIAADWYAKDLGKALGYLVGALVLGTAFPHFLRFQGQSLPWSAILLTTSAVAFMGGLLILFGVGDGPFRKKGGQFKPGVIVEIFSFREFRAAAYGYFGHMWELYAFWAFVPVILQTNPAFKASLSLWSFLIIGMGSLGCMLGGYWSLRKGSRTVAMAMLLTSGLCCLFSPLAFQLPLVFFLAFLLLWGFAVVGDSPQFSTLVAQTAPPLYIGSALTIVNCIGFSITIFSIELINWLNIQYASEWIYWTLLPGPVLGLIGVWKRK